MPTLVFSRYTISIALLFSTVSFNTYAEGYSRAEISDDERTLVFLSGGERFNAPRIDAEQAGFSKVRISADGKLAGWLTLYGNCCQSYPIPLSLVIFSNGKMLQNISESTPVWDWRFENHDTAVAYRHRTTHGASTVMYKLRRIADGKLLAKYECSSESEDTNANTEEIPDWVWSVAEECPIRSAETGSLR